VLLEGGLDGTWAQIGPEKRCIIGMWHIPTTKRPDLVSEAYRYERNETDIPGSSI
jgi:hypothetical protein